MIRCGVGNVVVRVAVVELVSLVDPAPVVVVEVFVAVFEVAEVVGGRQSAITWPPHFNLLLGTLYVSDKLFYY
jgi:hypothetical protein